MGNRGYEPAQPKAQNMNMPLKNQPTGIAPNMSDNGEGEFAQVRGRGADSPRNNSVAPGMGPATSVSRENSDFAGVKGRGSDKPNK